MGKQPSSQNQPVTPASEITAALDETPGMPPAPTPDTDPEIERVLTANTQQPIATPKTDKAGKPCQKCKKGVVQVYGMCIACYDKLPKVEKKKLYLLAKTTGVNTHEYPPEHLKAWRTELQLIAAGVWKGPLKIKAVKKSLGDLATEY